MRYAGPMDWADIGELIKVLGAVATATAAWFAAATAYRGLDKWRAEAIGKRKAELAEKVLTATYEMAELLRAAREPWVLPHETVKQEGIPDDVAQNSNFVPERRLLKHQDFFAHFRALKHEFAAVFGREAAKPFDDLWRVRIDVNHATHEMLRNPEMGKSRDQDDIQLWREWYRTAFRDPNEERDEINKRITASVGTVEEVCRAAIEGRTRPKN